MSRETNWFHDYIGEEEAPAERCFWRKVGFAIFIGLALALILGPLYGCATTKEEPQGQYCFLEAVGRTQGGLYVVKSLCMSPEQFAESQK